MPRKAKRRQGQLEQTRSCTRKAKRSCARTSWGQLEQTRSCTDFKMHRGLLEQTRSCTDFKMHRGQLEQTRSCTDFKMHRGHLAHPQLLRMHLVPMHAQEEEECDGVIGWNAPPPPK